MRRFWDAFREPWDSLDTRIDQVREAGDLLVPLGVFVGHARSGKVGRVSWFPTWAEALEAVGPRE